MIKLNSILNEVIDYEFAHYISGLSSLNEICCVLESPVRIGKINMDILDDTSKNYAYVLAAKKHGKLVGQYKDYEVYQFSPTNKKDDLHDVFIYNDLVYAYFNYSVDGVGFVWEKKIWQNHLSMGLFREIMFDYYLKKFEGVISDALFSPSGEKYWGKLLKQARDGGYDIYVLKDKKERIPLEDPEDINQYFTSTSYRFVIEKP